MVNFLFKSTLTLLLFTSVNGITQTLPEGQKAQIAQFTSQVSNSDWEALGESITYPLERNFPIPAIENKNDFIKRHSELFDDSLITMISSSIIDSNWSDGGLRGIVMKDAEIWLCHGPMKPHNLRSYL